MVEFHFSQIPVDYGFYWPNIYMHKEAQRHTFLSVTGGVSPYLRNSWKSSVGLRWDYSSILMFIPTDKSYGPCSREDKMADSTKLPSLSDADGCLFGSLGHYA